MGFPKIFNVLVKATVVLSLTSFAVSCEFLNKKKKKDPTPVQLLTKDKIYFSRSDDQKTGYLTLLLSGEAYCEVELWPVNTPTNDIAATAQHHLCSEGYKKDLFDEQIENLDTEQKYVIKIYVWRQGGSKDHAEQFVGHETDLTDYLPQPPPFGEMLVARMDLPLKSTNINRYEFTSMENLEEALGFMYRPIGCQRQIHPFSTPFHTPSPILKVRNLLTRGYASAPAVGNPFSGHHLSLDYEVLQPGDVWEFSYTMYKEYFEFVSIAPSNFLSLEMTSFNRVSIDKPTLHNLKASAQVSTNRQISLKWAAGNLLNHAYVIAFIQTDVAANNVVCYFDPTEQSALIHYEALSHLTPGRYNMTIYLESRQVHEVSQQTTHYWMISGLDWRSINLEFL